MAILNSMRLMSYDKKELRRIIFRKANRLQEKVKMETMKKDPKGSVKESKELKKDSAMKNTLPQ